MNADRGASTRSVVDVLDHVIDKGSVVDAWARLSVAGIDLLTANAHIVVASSATCLTYGGPLDDAVRPRSRKIRS